MDLNKVVLVSKLSKVEWDLKKYNLTQAELVKKYKSENVDLDKIFKSHERQAAALLHLSRSLPKENIMSIGDLNLSVLSSAELVISLGGDNHFQAVSYYLTSTPIVGVNSDPLTSSGNLLYYTSANITKLVTDLEKSNFKEEHWTRLKVIRNGELLKNLAMSEVFIGEKTRYNMSRYIVQYSGGKEEEVKCSGALVVTKAGSTGWLKSISKAAGSIKEDEYGYIPTELFYNSNNNPYMDKSLNRLSGKSSLKFYSLNDDNGIIAVDCLREYEFKRGDVVEISIAEQPLVVLKPKS